MANGNYQGKPAGAKPESVELHYVQNGRENEGVKLVQYGQKVSLNPYHEDQTGRRHMRFCFPKTKDGASDKSYPMGVDLGAPVEALGYLKQFVAVLEKEVAKSKGRG